MGGICGWVSRSVVVPTVLRDSMRQAMGHRGEVAWLDASGESPAVAIDSAFNSVEKAASLWGARSGETERFAPGLEGSFAVAAYDPAEDKLTLARDRFGEKPLYYAAVRSGIAFASEIKALRPLEAPGVLERFSVSPEAVDAFLTFTYIPAPLTIFDQVRKVPAGHCVTFDLGGLASGAPSAIKSSCYWSLPERSGLTARPDEMLERLRAAIRRRLPPSGAIGAFLSGGLDSSLVVALLAREGFEGLPTFSIGFTEQDLDESAHARRAASLAGTDHRVIRVEDVKPELVLSVIVQLDEPMADAATIPTYLLAREAAPRAKVVFTGDGADALLAGDHWFRRLKRLDALERLPAPFKALAAAGAGVARSRRRAPGEFSSMLALPPAARYLRIREKWTPSERLEIYNEEFRRRVDVATTEATYLRAPVTWRAGRSVEAAVRLDSIHGLSEDLLMKADKMGMAHGVESRSPFLDRELAEWSARLDIGLLLRGSSSKYLLKRAAEEVLPKDLVQRRKHGFQTPLGKWLKGSLRELTEAAFSPDLIRRQGIFDPAAMRELRSRFDEGAPPAALAGKIWQVVAFQAWWRQAFGS